MTAHPAPPIGAAFRSGGVTQSANCWPYKPTGRLCQLARSLPDSLQGSSAAEALAAIVDLDFIVLADIELPLGYGRD